MKTYWAGFLDGKLDTQDAYGYFGRDLKVYQVPAIYTRQRHARARYEDVRKIKVIVVKRRGKSVD